MIMSNRVLGVCVCVCVIVRVCVHVVCGLSWSFVGCMYYIYYPLLGGKEPFKSLGLLLLKLG